MAMGAVFWVLAALAAGHIHEVAAQCSRTDTSASAVHECVNFVRSDSSRYASEMCGAGDSVPPLNTNGQLTSAAQGHSEDMARNNFFSHGDWSGRIRRAGYDGNPISENIAFGYNSAFAVVAGWMCSSGHRRSLLSCRYDEVGTGVDCRGDTCYYTQNFGCSSGDCCARANNGPPPPPPPPPPPTPDPPSEPTPGPDPNPGPGPDPPPPPDAPNPTDSDDDDGPTVGGGNGAPNRPGRSPPSTGGGGGGFWDYYKRFVGAWNRYVPQSPPGPAPTPTGGSGPTGPAPPPRYGSPTRWYWSGSPSVAGGYASRYGSGNGSGNSSGSRSSCFFRWACGG